MHIKNTRNTHIHTLARTQDPFPEIEAMDRRLGDGAGWRPGGGTDVRGRGVAQVVGGIGLSWVGLDRYGTGTDWRVTGAIAEMNEDYAGYAGRLDKIKTAR